MPRKSVTDMSSWASLSLEGNLIAPAMVAKIDQRKAFEQSEESYGVRKGLSVREEISTAFRVGQSHYDAFVKLEAPSNDATRRFIREFLKETFAFDDLAPGSDGMSLIAGECVPIVVVQPGERLDKPSQSLSTDRPRSPIFALQDYLNKHEAALWGLAVNGTHLRLMRDSASLTRPAYIEADLSQIFENEDVASFAALWLMVHRSRFGNTGTPATDCTLERWREAGSREGEVARDRLAAQVQVALKVLGSGFLKANSGLAERLRSGELSLVAWFNELLRLVYRLIFLMVAEDRNLLHPAQSRAEARKLYLQGYSLTCLRNQSTRRAAWDKYHDRFEGLKIVFRALAQGQDTLALPALGGLFADDRATNLGNAHLSNHAFMEAIFRLAWLSDRLGMVPINWRAMETEELGSVYESLLELQPQLSETGCELRFASEAAEQRGNQRRMTGSYYTPDSLVQALLDTALDPVLDKTEAEADDPAKALLKLSIIDPACGSGHFLLAGARRIATRLAHIRAEGTPLLSDFRHALRDVARCCIHGVDRNPMAVELTKVALWIETVDPGLPLGFFDAQIRCGDALLGIFDLKVLEDGIPDAAYKPLTGDDKAVAKLYKRNNTDARKNQCLLDFTRDQSDLPAAPLSTEFSDLRNLPEDTVRDIEAKAKAYQSLRTQDAFLWERMGCDLYIAAFLLPKIGANAERTVPTSRDVWLAVGQGKGCKPTMESAKVAMKARAFHWPLEFPDIVGCGGFDVVLGNPPWGHIKLKEKEFFASRDAEIATAQSKAERGRLIKALRDADPGSSNRTLYEEFETEKRFREAISTFMCVNSDAGGRFPYTGTGDVNTYALFAELFSRLMSIKGRAGVIVPTGIATDSTTAPFFSWLMEEKRLANLMDFENTAPIFPTVASKLKFCLLTLGRDETEPSFAFFLSEPAEMADPERRLTLSQEQVAMFNPNTKSAPAFRSRWDAQLTAKIYGTVPILIDKSMPQGGNPWNVSFLTMFHMSNSRGLFRTAINLKEEGFVRDGTHWIIEGARPAWDTLEARGSDGSSLVLEGDNLYSPKRFVPLYEAKFCGLYDHRASSYRTRGGERGHRVLPPTGLEEHQAPSFEVEPFYWIDEEEVVQRVKRRGWRREYLLGWRGVTTATTERTMIPCIIPMGGAGHSFLVALPSCTPQRLCGLYSNWASLPFDFVVRQKTSNLNLTCSIVHQLPVFPPSFFTPDRLAFLTPRVLELTYTSHSLAPFARDLNHDGPPFAWHEDRRASLRANLDAFYARAYGLTRDELRYILDPTDIKGPDYPSETFRILKEREIRQHGEYRTCRLVLEAWDRMETDCEFEEMCM